MLGRLYFWFRLYEVMGELQLTNHGRVAIMARLAYASYFKVNFGNKARCNAKEALDFTQSS